MTGILLKNGSGTDIDDITSSVFPDYKTTSSGSAELLGWLHKISGVFLGTPAEVTTGGFPVQVNPAIPKLLSQSGLRPYLGQRLCGRLRRIFLSCQLNRGQVTASGQIDHGPAGCGTHVDSTAEKDLCFSSSDGSTTCPGGVPCSAVFEFAPGFRPGSTGGSCGRNQPGRAPNPNPLYEGAFDSTYEASGTRPATSTFAETRQERPPYIRFQSQPASWEPHSPGRC
jgi:hypothetical protein